MNFLIYLGSVCNCIQLSYLLLHSLSCDRCLQLLYIKYIFCILLFKDFHDAWPWDETKYLWHGYWCRYWWNCWPFLMVIDSRSHHGACLKRISQLIWNNHVQFYWSIIKCCIISHKERKFIFIDSVLGSLMPFTCCIFHVRITN
jgi:hypothetical protein